MNNLVVNGVSLEVLNSSHAQAIYELTENNREYLRQWLPWVDCISHCSDTNDFILSVSSQYVSTHFSIFYQGEICGVIGFDSINQQHAIGVVGYWVDQKTSGKGIATTALLRLLSIGFNEYYLNKIEVKCAENNFKSRSIPERLGFRYEATLRECEWLYTKYVNHAVYSMLSSEFTAGISSCSKGSEFLNLRGS